MFEPFSKLFTGNVTPVEQARLALELKMSFVLRPSVFVFCLCIRFGLAPSFLFLKRI